MTKIRNARIMCTHSLLNSPCPSFLQHAKARAPGVEDAARGAVCTTEGGRTSDVIG